MDERADGQCAETDKRQKTKRENSIIEISAGFFVHFGFSCIRSILCLDEIETATFDIDIVSEYYLG